MKSCWNMTLFYLKLIKKALKLNETFFKTFYQVVALSTVSGGVLMPNEFSFAK